MSFQTRILTCTIFTFLRHNMNLAVASLFLSTCLCGLALGDRTASFYDGNGFENNFSFTVGWFFTPLEDIIVTKVGIYDLEAPGLIDSHDIGIFETNGDLVVSSSIGAGLSGTLIDGTLFVDITPTPLVANTGYYINATNWQNDNFVYGPGNVTYAPEIQWDGNGSEAALNDIFADFTNFGGAEGNLGPNFQFIPEPSSLMLLLVGLPFLRHRPRRILA